jgi:hypothetical protein
MQGGELVMRGELVTQGGELVTQGGDLVMRGGVTCYAGWCEKKTLSHAMSCW